MDWKIIGNVFAGALPTLLAIAGVWLSNKERFTGIDKRIDEMKSDMLREFGKVEAALLRLTDFHIDHEVRLRLMEGKRNGEAA